MLRVSDDWERALHAPVARVVRPGGDVIVIRSGSSSIIPKEVEDVIVLHPAVAEVAVIGLPDAEWGEAVTAFVVAKPGMAVTERDLVEHCRLRLAGYKKPRSIRFVASLPRSHYGKVLRAQLIAQATD